MKLKDYNFVFYSILILFVLISCIPIRYIGDEFPPTQKIQVFYSAKEIQLKHIIFGHILGSGGNVSKIKEKLKKEAMDRGANAILFTGVDFEDSEVSRTNKISASLIKYLE